MRDKVPQHEIMLLVFRIVLALWLIWAGIGVAGYWKLAQSMGWDRLSVEVNVSIFLGITVAGLAVIAALVYLTYRLFKPR